ncbi:MAG: fibrobacter succinogenes major paralogous domain-containing protein [Brumimicrobium sp.]
MKKTLVNLAFVIISTIMMTGCGGSNTYRDQNGNIIKTVEIDNNIWMAENLNVDKFLNGDPIPEAKTKEEWVKAGQERKAAWCYYNNDPENGKKYGKLYNWYAVIDERGIVPKGWRVPSFKDWGRMMMSLGGLDIAGDILKSTSGWLEEKNGKNSIGFNGEPNGCRNYNGEFHKLSESSYWWTTTEQDTKRLWYIGVNYQGSQVGSGYALKEMGLAIRCVRD